MDSIRAEYFPRVENIGGYGVDREFKSCPPPYLVVNHQIDWQQFHNFLMQRMTAKTAEDRIQYAKRYVDILVNNNNGNACNALLSARPNTRIHIMKALSCLARYTGRAEQWRQIRQHYQLSWSTGTEKIDAFTRFFDSDKSLDVMLRWLHEAVNALPSQYANLLLFCTLTGMRGTECVEAIRLLANVSQNFGEHSYYNPERQILQHYLFPQIFIRRTKAIYISVVNDEIIGIGHKIGNTPTLKALEHALKRRCLSMRIKYCRKIHASWLHQKGISSDMIDMLQGRISKNIFLRHYLVPSSDFKDKVLDAMSELQKEIKVN